MEIVTLIGSVGAMLILVAFIMEQTHRWKDTDLKYDVVNLLGSFFLIVYALLLHSYPFLILNSVWFFVSLRDVIFDLKRK